MRRSAKPELRIYGNTCLGWCSLAQLLRPVDGRDEHAQRILAQPLGIARRLNGDGENGRPALRAGELTVLIAALGPGDAKAVGRGADHAGDVDRDLDPSDLGERIVGAGLVVARLTAATRGAVMGRPPVLAADNTPPRA